MVFGVRRKCTGKLLWASSVRSFLIDENGNIEHAWYKISPKNTIPELMKVLD